MPKDAPSLAYARLRQQHPDYDASRMEQIDDLYEGGWTICRKSKKYLPKLALEDPSAYAARCLTSSYQPYFGQIVDQFVADLFTQPLTIAPAGDADNPETPGEYPDPEFYPAFSDDCDGQGVGLVDLMAGTLTTALKHLTAYVMVDAPDTSAEPAPANLAEEDARGARRIYAYEVPPQQVLDWKLDKRGAYEWVILACKTMERRVPGATRDKVREEYTIWTAATGGATWARYVVEYDPKEPPKDDDAISPEASGQSTFAAIPLLRMKLKPGLWVGNKIGPQALEHWRRRSALIGAENRSCVAIPYVTLGPEMPAMGQDISEKQQDPGRGSDPRGKFESQGFLELGKDDEVGFAEPTGSSYEIIDKQVDGVRESMFSVNHQMAASIRPTNTALGRSGLSKQKDQDSTSKVLGALGRVVRRFSLAIYDLVSKARGEDVVWVAHGLDSYEVDQRAEVLEESLSLQQVAIPSATFRKEHAKRVFQKLVPNLPPDTVATITKEIDEGIDNEQDLRDLMDEAKKDALENPPPAGAPGMPVPGAKKPPPPQGKGASPNGAKQQGAAA